MMWFTFKSMVFSVEILFYNLMNGFSADTNVDDLSYSMYGVLNTLFVSYFYLLSDLDISGEDYKTKDISSVYLFNFNNHLSWKNAQLSIYLLAVWIIGGLSFFLPAYGAMLSKDGKTNDYQF